MSFARHSAEKERLLTDKTFFYFIWICKIRLFFLEKQSHHIIATGVPPFAKPNEILGNAASRV